MDGVEPVSGGPRWMTRMVEVLQPASIRVDRLAATELFAGVPRSDLELAAGLLGEALIERGARMTVQGAATAKVWLILEGQALVSADARPVRVASHGHLIGLASMFYQTISPETTIALSPIRAFEADSQQFRRLMENTPIRTRFATAAAVLNPKAVARRRSSAAG